MVREASMRKCRICSSAEKQMESVMNKKHASRNFMSEEERRNRIEAIPPYDLRSLKRERRKTYLLPAAMPLEVMNL